MQLTRNAQFYKNQIDACKRNIEFVKNSNFCEKEKQDLTLSYEQQIINYKRHLKSFSEKVAV